MTRIAAATEAEDAAIKPIGCLGACMAGRRGMDRCAKCDGSGSQLIIPDGSLFPNTKEGYIAALTALRKSPLGGWRK